MSLLKCSSVFKAFGNIEALCDVSIDVNPGEILAVVGESGGVRLLYYVQLLDLKLLIMAR